MSGNIVKAEYNEKHNWWILKHGNETFFDKDCKMLTWETREQAHAWLYENHPEYKLDLGPFIKDVTNNVDFNNPDDECLPIIECVCGEKFAPWKFFISIYKDHPYQCPNCNKKLFFTQEIHVYEIE